MDPNVAGYIHWPKCESFPFVKPEEGFGELTIIPDLIFSLDGDDLQIIQFSSIGSWIITDNFRQAASTSSQVPNRSFRASELIFILDSRLLD